MAGALGHFNFIKDLAYLRINSSGAYNSVTIANRNIGFPTDTITGTTEALVDRFINDVAMTVLPNAPIDSATGLPVPTIAVATNGGVSVIKDDGTVVDITTSDIYKLTTNVSFEGEKLIWGWDGYSNLQRFIHVLNTIPSSDINFSGGNIKGPADAFYSSSSDVDLAIFNDENSIQDIVKHDIALVNNPNRPVQNHGIIRIYPNYQSPSAGLFANISKDYNTGWMNGDIKLATLSDTDATDVTGSELLTNGTLDSATGWSFSGSGEYTITGGQLVDSGTQGYEFYSPVATVEIGKTYTATFEADGSGGTPTIRIVDTSSNVINNVIVSNGGGLKQYSITFTPTGSQTSVRFEGSGQAWTGYYDNFSIRLAEEDRSVNNNGLQVFGTVTKNPVATGADLVAYSGFSASNYLEQPYNSDLDFGTGDFSIMGWINYASVSTFNYVFERQPGKVELYISPSDILVFYCAGAQITAPSVMSKNVWNHICITRPSSGTATMFINSIPVITGITSGSINVTDGSGVVLGSRGNDHGFYPLENGSLSLWRISATIPSNEQIKKIYEDEKVLFQENAKATLYGTSDAVTALAYDDDTDLLHVGTSAGRSVFQGLRRIDNTTDAVGSAISASNGMVAED